MRLRYVVMFALVAGAINTHASDVWDGTSLIPVHKVDLLDENGVKILEGEKSPNPFSSRKTCGACHDYEKIQKGWHFSAKGELSGRSSEPWILLDEKTGTQVPFSLRDDSGIMSRADAGLGDWDFVRMLGRNLAGGGPGENRGDGIEKGARWGVSGDLEINCMACHNGSKCQDFSEWVKQIARQNFRWAATAASGLAEVSGVAERMSDSWVPEDGYNLDDMFFNVPPSVKYRKEIFDSKSRAILDIGKPADKRCLQCHSVAAVGAKKHEVTPDVHAASGISCVKCHRNGIEHRIDRGVSGMYSCEGCHNEGTYGAPAASHKGLPPLHLEKMTCTACHSGEVIDEKGSLALVRTSKANRLGVHGRAQWFTEAPRILEPVFVKGADGRIGPARIMWPSFWGKKSGGDIALLAPEVVMDQASEIIDPAWEVSGILASLANVKDSSGNQFGKPVFITGGKVYEKNFDGGLDVVDDEGLKPSESLQFGYIVSNTVDALSVEYDTSEANAFYSYLSEDERNHVQVLLETLRAAAPEGTEPVWKLNNVLHRVVDVDYELVSKEEVAALKKAVSDARSTVKKSADLLGVSAEVEGTRQVFYRKSDKEKLKVSKKKTPKLYELKLLVRKLVDAEEELGKLEVFGEKAYRNTFDAGIARRLLIENSDIGPKKGSMWGWLKDNSISPLVSDDIKKFVGETAGGDEIVLSENQVSLILKRLGKDSVYVSQGKVFSLDAEGSVQAEDHKLAEPVTWPVAHDVRPASQSLGSKGCKECHADEAGFLFASVTPQGALVSDKVESVAMHELAGVSERLHELYGSSFKYREAVSLVIMGCVGLVGLVVLLFALIALSQIVKKVSGKEVSPL